MKNLLVLAAVGILLCGSLVHADVVQTKVFKTRCPGTDEYTSIQIDDRIFNEKSKLVIQVFYDQSPFLGDQSTATWAGGGGATYGNGQLVIQCPKNRVRQNVSVHVIEIR